MAQKAMDVCLQVSKESNKSRLVNNSVRKQCIDHFQYYLLRLLREHFVRHVLEIAVYRKGQ